MKKHVSVFMLMARSSVYRVFLSILAVSLLQALGFYLSCNGILLGRGATLVDTLTTSLFFIFFAVGLFAITFFLCRTGWEASAKTGYTLKRLSISERQVFLWQAFYNTLIYVLYWFCQSLLLFGLARWYIAAQGGGDLTEFMLFFRSGLARGFWSMEDPIGFVRNALFCLMLGLASARYPMAQRNGKRFGEIFPVFLLTLALWNRALVNDGGSDALAYVLSLVFIGLSLVKATSKEETEDYYDDY